jgi:transposase
VLSVPSSVRIYVCTEACDMRRSFNGLDRMTREIIGQDPLSGHIFVFLNRRRDRVKLLYWENGGYVIHYKLLERGSFRVPESNASGAVVIEAADLMMIMQGIDITATHRRRWWSPPRTA